MSTMAQKGEIIFDQLIPAHIVTRRRASSLALMSVD